VSLVLELEMLLLEDEAAKKDPVWFETTGASARSLCRHRAARVVTGIGPFTRQEQSVAAGRLKRP
jgi:hypothetical protein